MPNNLTNTLKTIENKLRRDANMSGQIDYNEQIAWMLFLKALDVLEKNQKAEAKLSGKSHKPILDVQFRWSGWTKKDWTAEEKAEFIKQKLLPHLRSLSGSNARDLVAQVFGDIPTKLLKSPYTQAEVLDLIDNIDLNNPDDTHTVSLFYEESLQKMGSAGRQAGGEFYTPRPIIRLIIKILDPQIGETILDPFLGSGGFLAETFVHLKASKDLKAKEYEKLQNETFLGQELKPIPFLLGTMNCILHGLYGAKLLHINSFAKDIRTIKPDERVNIVMTNPPFGAEVERTYLENFPFPTTSTQVLAVQYILRRLKPGGRCGMVVDEGFLSRTNEKAFVNTKKELLEENNLFAVVSLPQGVFTGVGTGVKTNLIFFEKGKKTKDVWYYELTGKFTKTKPVTDKHLDEAWQKFQNRSESDSSWLVKPSDIKNYDLTAKNPNGQDKIKIENPGQIVTRIVKRENEISKLLKQIKKDL